MVCINEEGQVGRNVS